MQSRPLRSSPSQSKSHTRNNSIRLRNPARRAASRRTRSACSRDARWSSLFKATYTSTRSHEPLSATVTSPMSPKATAAASANTPRRELRQEAPTASPFGRSLPTRGLMKAAPSPTRDDASDPAPDEGCLRARLPTRGLMKGTPVPDPAPDEGLPAEVGKPPRPTRGLMKEVPSRTPLRDTSDPTPDEGLLPSSTPMLGPSPTSRASAEKEFCTATRSSRTGGDRRPLPQVASLHRLLPRPRPRAPTRCHSVAAPTGAPSKAPAPPSLVKAAAAGASPTEPVPLHGQFQVPQPQAKGPPHGASPTAWPADPKAACTRKRIASA